MSLDLKYFNILENNLAKQNKKQLSAAVNLKMAKNTYSFIILPNSHQTPSTTTVPHPLF